MSDQFNPDSFLNMTVDTANDTKVIPCPVGEFPGVIKDVKFAPWQSTKNGEVRSGIRLDVYWTIDDEGCKQVTGRDEVVVKQGIMLDTLEGGSGLDMGKGKNIQLGRLREAVDLNTPGEPFSFGMLTGRLAKVTINHREANGDLYPEVKAAAKFQ